MMTLGVAAYLFHKKYLILIVFVLINEMVWTLQYETSGKKPSQGQ